LLDGDDYWTDEYKLQKQVSFLEKNVDYSICFHPVSIIRNGKVIDDFITRNVPETTEICELAKGNYMHTCSCVFRNNTPNYLPDSFFRVPAADYFLHMLNAKHGKIKRLPEKMAMYRMHNDSIHATKSQNQRNVEWIQQLINMYPHFDKPVREILLRSLSDRIDEIIINDDYKEEIKIEHIVLKAKLFPKDIHKLLLENRELKRKLNSRKEALRFLLKSIKQKVLF
jgi:hypothetical protein